MKPLERMSRIWRTIPMNREIDYKELLKNINEMIITLEFDSMRSAGKAKMNSQHLHSLYFLKEKYEVKLTPNKKKEG